MSQMRISAYCSQCNDPKGCQACDGKSLQAYSAYQVCAINGAKAKGLLGKQIYVQSNSFTGNLQIRDHCGKDNTIDIWMGQKQGDCKCKILEWGTVYGLEKK